MNSKKKKRLLHSLHSYILFFMLVSFIITCNMTLFMRILYHSPFQNIETAAKLTFGNVIFLSLVLTVINGIIKRVTVKTPVRKIIDASEKIISGDFSVRIKGNSLIYRYEKFNDIINCFNKMAAELESVETLRTDFISNVSHEIKTPLAVINNYTVLLQNENITPEERKEYVNRIYETTNRLANLITNILKLNKLDNQQISPVFKEYNLSESLRENILSFESIWTEKNITISTEIDDNIIISSDREMLDLVWSNILSNAFKFTDLNGNVSIKAKSDKDFIIVEISDDGCGITETVKKRMFDKFYQGDASRASQGNGLGLSLVKRAINIVNGEIKVQSEVNVGTSIIIKLPV